MAGVARLVTSDEGLSKADVDAWVGFATLPPDEVVDAAATLKELGVLAEKDNNSESVKRAISVLSDVGVKTSKKGRKTLYHVSAMAMTCVILALPEVHKARRTLLKIKQAFRTFLTHKTALRSQPAIELPTKKRTQSEPAAPLESPAAKRIKPNMPPTHACETDDGSRVPGSRSETHNLCELGLKTR